MSDRPKRIRLSRAKGWRLPDGAVNCARPGKWGNLFVVGRHGTRLQCAAKFGLLAGGFIALSEADVEPEAQLALWQRIRRSAKRELEGRDLACWCSLDGPCHVDVLHCVANGLPAPEWMRQQIEMPRIRLGMSADDYARLLRSAQHRLEG